MGAPPQTSRTRVAVNAMATRFEIVISGENPARARAAGEEALEEIVRIERCLSLFRATSAVSDINRNALEGPVQPPREVFDLLLEAKRLWTVTHGAFDLTIGAVMDEFRNAEAQDSASCPTARLPTRIPGMSQLELDLEHHTVRFLQPGTQLDLGGIAKGYAIDRAAEILQEAGIQHALLHGGTSTSRAFGMDGGAPWTIAVSHPHPDHSTEILASVALRDGSLSLSSIYGRGFEQEGGWVGHVIDPRTGASVSETELAAVVADTATASDAMSTALLVLGAANMHGAGTGSLSKMPAQATLIKSKSRITTTGDWNLANFPQTTTQT